MKNAKTSIAYDVFVNVAKGHQDGLRAYAAHAVGTPTTKVGKALGLANVIIALAAFSVGMGVLTVKAYEAGEHIGESLESLGEKIKALKGESPEAKLRALKERKTVAKATVSDEAKEGLENYIAECRNKFSVDDLEAMADRAVKRAETRDLSDEEAEELGL